MNTPNRIMFVDDEEGVRLSWNRFLSERGFDVTTVPDGDSAIHMLQEAPVDVVVSDLRMPGSDGLDLLSWVKSHRPETRFILLTGYGSDSVERMARELGAFEYLNKPISPEALSAIVTAAAQLGLLEEEDTQEVEAAAATKALEAATALEAPTALELPPDLEMLAEAREEAEEKHGLLRSTAEVMFGLIVAPILGLLFAMFLPFIGIGALIWVAVQSARDAILNRGA
jgi:DNA-binding NtrC family response regulator